MFVCVCVYTKTEYARGIPEANQVLKQEGLFSTRELQNFEDLTLLKSHK